MTTELCELALKYRCDKTPAVAHGYTPYYHELLRNRPIKRILEVGIGSASCMAYVPDYVVGASLYMWQDYFPEAEVFGLDIDPTALVNTGRIKSYVCDQGSIASLLEAMTTIGGKFDLIVDDGSHRPEHQVLTANVLIPLVLEQNGLYIIEDMLHPEWVIPLLQYKCTMKEFDLTKIPDDRVLVFEGQQRS